MAQVWRLKADTHDTIFTGTINNDAYGLCDEIDNSTGLWQSAWVKVDFDFTAAGAAGAFLHVSIKDAQDGTNYSDQVPTAFQARQVASLKTIAATSQHWAFYIPKLPPTKFILWVGNFSGKNGDTTSTVSITLTTKELQSA
jgi:hypothetical protein